MPPERKNRSAKKITDSETRKAKPREAKTRDLKSRDVKARDAKAQDVKTRQVTQQRSPAASSVARPASSKQTSVAIIGAGRLGAALALALSQHGYRVVVLVARRAQRARLAARAITPQPLALAATELNSLPDTDLLLVTTPDDQIAAVAARLAQVFAARDASAPPSRRPARIALHASGALTSDALAPLGAHAFSLGSLHPLVSISDPSSGASNLRGAFYCLEGEARARAAASKIVRALGGKSFFIAARRKPLYHAAAVMSAGHLVALFSLATEMLARCGLSERQATRVLLPLAASTLENLARGTHPASALTGPFARADVATLRRHLIALRESGTGEMLPVYVALGRHAIRLARERGGADAASRAALAEIEALLEEES